MAALRPIKARGGPAWQPVLVKRGTNERENPMTTRPMTTRRFTILAAAACAATFLAAPAFAQRGPGQGPVAQHCNDDIVALCPGATHRPQNRAADARACLQRNIDKVSPACRQALQTTRGGRRR